LEIGRHLDFRAILESVRVAAILEGLENQESGLGEERTQGIIRLPCRTHNRGA